MELSDKIDWRKWTPWLFDDQCTIDEVVNSIPSDPKIPFIVKVFENPRSPLYLPGPTDMHVHDAIHVLLGRGLLNQDEAFVIGFCMGAARGGSNYSRLIFEFVGTNLYPGFYKFSSKDMVAFNLAFDYAQQKKQKYGGIHLMTYNEIKNMSVVELRGLWGLSHSVLVELYNKEHSILPETDSTLRLPKS